MKDPQDPGNSGLEHASNESVSGSPATSADPASSPQVPLVGPDSPRRLDVDPDSPMAVVVSLTHLSTGVRLAELQAVAGLFLSDALEKLRYAFGDEIYYHATFTETVGRFITARDGLLPERDDFVDPWTSTGFVLEGRPLDESDDAAASAGAAADDGAEADDASDGGADVAADAAAAAAADESDGAAELGVDGSTDDASTTEASTGEQSQPPSASSLPNFPKFGLHKSFNSWVHDLATREEIAELTTVLGSSSDGAYNEITNAVTLAFGLPKFLQRCLAGEFTIEHVLAATRAIKDVAFEYLPRLDAYLGDRRADITLETFRKSLNLKIAAIVPVDDRTELAEKRRRVDIMTYPDGTASVTLSGPAVELNAFYLRIEAFARAIRNGNISALTDENIAGLEVADQDSIAALMFDIATRATPQMTIAVTAHDTTTGETTTKEVALETADDADPAAPITAAAVDRTAQAAQREAEEAAGTGADVKTTIKLVMPTHGQWVREQAKMMVTVPYLTAVGKSELPGTFSDGTPVPPDAARALAGESPTWHRILTDPATGTPIDARSRSYHIPADVRAPLVGKWQSCSAPGCTRRAETSEVDHIIPFDHADPARGGQTTFENLHPLCKPDHQAKTDRRFSVRMTEDGAVEYSFTRGVVARMYPPDNPINAEHARQVENYDHLPNLLDDRNPGTTEQLRDNGHPRPAARVEDSGPSRHSEPGDSGPGDGCVPTPGAGGVSSTETDEAPRRSQKSKPGRGVEWNNYWESGDPPPF
ncbi:HNH endonuclease signature motif containing protein [Brevibacterium linens]|uniref:HNH endonuclease n=1 Tax=Brevibacterium linens TaxID=1703 RepID=A0A2H1I311_BRELN|nr:HNH endonuclease signature motif containing protein [Brevibacterium linens]SMX69502.1 HNH endonuclease [Brevibacterium linens]